MASSHMGSVNQRGQVTTFYSSKDTLLHNNQVLHIYVYERELILLSHFGIPVITYKYLSYNWGQISLQLFQKEFSRHQEQVFQSLDLFYILLVGFVA